MIEVSAALIWRGENFLICQRPQGKANALLWEFVGGKREAGESDREALIRECKEELDVTVSVGDVFVEVTHEYPELTVHLTLFNAGIEEGEPRLLEHRDLRWISPMQVDEYEFCAADTAIVQRIRQEYVTRAADELRARLFALRDEDYRLFQAKLIPTVNIERIIGVRTPAIRALAREYKKTTRAAAFMSALPHEYFDEDILHGCFIQGISDYDRAVAEVERFLPYVDNWASCDLLSPKALKKRPEELLSKIEEWTRSDQTYTVRFGLEMLMSFFLDEAFKPQYLELAARVKSTEYYVNMMTAWFFATALAKQYEATLPYIEQRRLDPWTHNKTIQKAIESYRVTDEHKAVLRALKIAKTD